MRRPTFPGWAAVWMGYSLTGDISGGEEAGKTTAVSEERVP